jgi:hypothetical protein
LTVLPGQPNLIVDMHWGVRQPVPQLNVCEHLDNNNFYPNVTMNKMNELTLAYQLEIVILR